MFQHTSTFQLLYQSVCVTVWMSFELLFLIYCLLCTKVCSICLYHASQICAIAVHLWMHTTFLKHSSKREKKILKSFKYCLISHWFKRLCNSFAFRLLDFTAFDSADHSILSLMEQIGIKYTALEWFKSFSGSLGGFVSSSALLIHGVPQGSVLEPISFLFFSDVIHIQYDITIHSYVDITQIYLQLNPFSLKLYKLEQLQTSSTSRRIKQISLDPVEP